MWLASFFTLLWSVWNICCLKAKTINIVFVNRFFNKFYDKFWLNCQQFQMHVVSISTACSMVKYHHQVGWIWIDILCYSKFMLNYLQGTVSQCHFSYLIHVSGAVSISFNYNSWLYSVAIIHLKY